MLILNNYQTIGMKRQSMILKESTRYDAMGRSPKQQKVENSRKIIKINDAIKSIMSIGNMQKMQFIAINNRNLFNYGKVKRAQWTNRKSFHDKTHFLPNLKALKVQTGENIGRRASESKSVKKMSGNSYKMPEIEQALCEKYIEEYLKKLKQQQRYDLLEDREELIVQACKEIHLKIEQSKINQTKKQLRQFYTREDNKEQEPPAKQFKGLSVSRKIKSITEASYNQQINRINRNSEYSNKQRMLNEKMFLRRIKGLKK